MDSPPPRRRVHAAFGAGLLLVTAVVAVFAGSLRAPFVFDDVHAILLNPHLARLWPPDASLWAVEQSPLSGRPVTAFTFAVDHALGGHSTYGYHVVNLALHALTACMLLALLRRVLATRGDGDATDVTDGPSRIDAAPAARTGLAFAVALLWAIHPLQSEAVTYVVQRTELLSAAFLVGCVLAAVRGMSAERRAGWFALSIACAWLGVGSKETVVVAPVLVLLVDRALGRRTVREALRRHRALYIGLASSWLAVAAIVASGPRSDSVGFHHGVSAWTWLLTQSEVLTHYLGLALRPSTLTVSYGWPLAESLLDVLPEALLIVGLLAVTAVGVARNTRWGLAGAWFFVLLAPTSSLVPIVTEVAAERRMYLPLLAVVALVVVALDALVRRAAGAARDGAAAVRAVASDADAASRPADAAAPAPRAVLLRTVVPVVGVVALAGVASRGTVDRVAEWKDPVVLWGEASRARPGNRMAHAMFGDALRYAGRLEEALPAYDRALAVDPDDFHVLQNKGNCLLELHRFDEAVAAHTRAVELYPDVALARRNLAVTLLVAGRLEESLEQVERCLELEPWQVEHRLLAATLLVDLDRVPEARTQLEIALDRAPGHPAIVDALERLPRAP